MSKTKRIIADGYIGTSTVQTSIANTNILTDLPAGAGVIKLNFYNRSDCTINTNYNIWRYKNNFCTSI